MYEYVYIKEWTLNSEQRLIKPSRDTLIQVLIYKGVNSEQRLNNPSGELGIQYMYCISRSEQWTKDEKKLDCWGKNENFPVQLCNWKLYKYTFLCCPTNWNVKLNKKKFSAHTHTHTHTHQHTPTHTHTHTPTHTHTHKHTLSSSQKKTMNRNYPRSKNLWTLQRGKNKIEHFNKMSFQPNSPAEFS